VQAAVNRPDDEIVYGSFRGIEKIRDIL
jgi:hypothetical protein